MSFLRHWLQVVYFLIEDTHNNSLPTNFEKFLSKKKFWKKLEYYFLNVDKSKSLNKSNSFFSVLVPKNHKHI